MGKYLIQDIVPPQKKHPSPAKKITLPHHEHVVEEHVDPTAHHEGAVHHVAHHKTDVAHAHHVKPHKSHEEEETQNPHTMISDQLEMKEEQEFTPVIDKPHIASVSHEPVVSYGVAQNDNARGSQYSTPPPHFDGDDGGAKRSGWMPWILGPLTLVGAIFLILNFLSGATVTLIAKSSTVPMDQKFSATKDKTGAMLPYSVMKIELTDTYEVPATGTKTVTTKATGQIVVYNEQVSAQRLIKNTRFESPTGKIYRINESITVPKSTTKTGKLIPGSLEVTIYADEAGAEYNSSATDFSVPGLKNTPQAKLVYARSRGALAGGASGTIKSVSDQDLKKAGEDLRISLETKLRTKARGDLAPSQVTYDQGIVIELKDSVLSSDKASSDEKAVVTKSGTLYMIVFDRTLLTKAITKAIVPTYGGEEVSLGNLEQLVFSADQLSGTELWNNPSINFSLKGAPELKWLIDEAAVKKDLLGLPKADFNSKMSSYPTIERAKASLRPFWKQNFPKDSKAITINIVEEIAD